MTLLDTRFLITSGLLVGALLLGAFIISCVRRWQQMSSRGGATANAQLAHFRQLYDRGELSLEEFRKLRDVLSGQIRKETGLPDDKPPPKPPPPDGVKTP